MKLSTLNLYFQVAEFPIEISRRALSAELRETKNEVAESAERLRAAALHEAAAREAAEAASVQASAAIAEQSRLGAASAGEVKILRKVAADDAARLEAERSHHRNALAR